MNKPTRIGVIGGGYWGEKLIAEYLRLCSRNQQVKLCAVVDTDPARLKYLGDKYNLPDKILYGNQQGVLDISRISEEVDAIHIATPNETHYQIAMDAIERGKHVLIEKPMTTSSRCAFRLAREAEKAGTVLLVDHIFRFNNAVNKAKRMIERVNLGDVHYLDLRWTTYMGISPNVDILFDLSPHPIDVVNHLLEEWPTCVYSTAKAFRRKGLEEVAFTTMELPGDRMAGITLSWLQSGDKARTVTIVGEDATLCVDALNQRVVLCKNEEKPIVVEVEANNTIEAALAHFVDRITNGSPPINSPLIGAMTVHVIEKMRESVTRRATVDVMAVQ